MNTYAHKPPIAQQGFILFLTLILLIMLTVLALTQVSLNSTQTRIAANATDAEISFEKTEGAINEAINFVTNGTYVTDNFLRNNNGLYLLNQNAANIWTTVNWSSNTAVIKSFQGGSGAQAAYLIEQLPSVIKPGQNMKTPTHIFRVTGRSLGASGNTSVLLQSTLQVP